MTPSAIGEAIERVLVRYDSQSSVLQIAAGIVLGIAVTAASLLVFKLTLQILVDYFR